MKVIRARIRQGRLTHPDARHDLELLDLENRDVVLVAITPLNVEQSERAAAVLHALFQFEQKHGEKDRQG